MTPSSKGNPKHPQVETIERRRAAFPTGVDLMPRIVLSFAEWKAVRPGTRPHRHRSSAVGVERAHSGNPRRGATGLAEQGFALELDASSAETVQAIYTSLSGEDHGADQRAAAVAEAMQIIHDHQQRT